MTYLNKLSMLISDLIEQLNNIDNWGLTSDLFKLMLISDFFFFKHERTSLSGWDGVWIYLG